MLRTAERVAVTGIGVLSALGGDPEQIFTRMKAMITGIGTIEKFDTGKLLCRIGAEIKTYRADDHFSTEEQAKYDLCAQYAIVAARQALEDSGLERIRDGNERIGLALGTCNGGILSLEEQWTLSELDEGRTARYPFYQQGDHVADYFRLTGPLMTMNTACAASGNAIGFGYDMIRHGYADTMLAGGSDPLSHTVYAGFNVLRALNQQPTSPFGDRYGLSLGEGAAFVVLEPWRKAVGRGAKIYAEICGYGLSNDAHHETASAPEGTGIRDSAVMALRQSGVDKTNIGYINAHGTGTKANDAAEINGLRQVFGDIGLAAIPLSSSKAYFGHNLGAAAAMEFVTSLYALRQGFIPATLHHDALREGCEGVDIVANHMREGQPDFIMSNNSAFGGHNASLIARMPYAAAAPAPAEFRPGQRIGIVGMGMISRIGVSQGSVLKELLVNTAEVAVAGDTVAVDPVADPVAAEALAAAKSIPFSFSLKEYNKDLYDRRMNRLCQNSIGAAHLAMGDAGWPIDEADGDRTGLLFGTSRGSTESIGKYLSSIFEASPELASGIHFPFNVVNSTAGKMAQKLRIKGFSSSISTGGNDGLAAVLYSTLMFRSGIHDRCLVGAGDEFSELSAKIDQAKGLHESRFEMADGSCCLALAELTAAQAEGKHCYAEINGCGMTYNGTEDARKNGSEYAAAVEQALSRSSLQPKQIDFVLFNSVGRPGEMEQEQQWLQQFFSGCQVPVLCLNERLGYGESLSALQHLVIAADLLHTGVTDALTSLKLTKLFPASLLARQGELKHGLVVSSSVNGNNVAIVVSRVEPL